MIKVINNNRGSIPSHGRKNADANRNEVIAATRKNLLVRYNGLV
jgi:hypothetical protein